MSLTLNSSQSKVGTNCFIARIFNSLNSLLYLLIKERERERERERVTIETLREAFIQWVTQFWQMCTYQLMATTSSTINTIIIIIAITVMWYWSLKREREDLIVHSGRKWFRREKYIIPCVQFRKDGNWIMCVCSSVNTFSVVKTVWFLTLTLGNWLWESETKLLNPNNSKSVHCFSSMSSF